MGMHPLVPEDQAEGYRELIKNLSEDLKVITGFAGVSLQPNSGAAGRICRPSCDSCTYLESIGRGHRNKVHSSFGSRNKSCVCYTGRICNLSPVHAMSKEM